jgi:hypothetical protein
VQKGSRLLAGRTTIEIMDRDALWRDVLDVLRAGPSLPSRRARDSQKREAAEVRSRSAWQRVAWAIEGLQALLLLRDELREREHQVARELRDDGGLHRAPPQLLDELALRQTQVREVLVAFLSQAKVLLDLLAQAVAAALGNPGGFAEKHGSLGVRLDEFALARGVAKPPDDLVERARELDGHVADVRNDVLVHPKLSGQYARQFVYPRGSDLEISTLFPNEEREPSHIAIAEVDAGLEAYTRDLAQWVASVLDTATPLGETHSPESPAHGESSA